MIAMHVGLALVRRTLPVTDSDGKALSSRTQRLRKTLHVGAVVVAVAMIGLNLAAGARTPSLKNLEQQEFITHLEAAINRGMHAGDIPGVSVLLVREGEPIWSQAFGYADREQDVALSTQHVMMAHSISKSVSAWGVMRLLDQGLIELDDPVLDYLGGWQFPDSPYDARAVTVRRLLSLSAGMPLGPIGVHYAPEEATPPLKAGLVRDSVRLFREPGSGFAYSNSSFALLELLIERVTGRAFTAYMETEVLRPLGMHTASFAWDPAWEVPLGYRIDGTPVEPFLYPNRASGGLFATIHDLGRFAAVTATAPSNAAESPVLSPAARTEMYAPQVPIPGVFGVVADSYGLGHFLEELSGGHTAAWHGGQGLGWMTHFHAIPETGDAIVILTNSQRSWPFMARILGDWSRWIGLGPVGMSRITGVVTTMRILVGLLFLFALWRTLTVLLDLANGLRRLALGRFGKIQRRHIELLVALAMTATVVWASQQEYLFITSVFPRETPWFAGSLIVTAGALAFSALFPVHNGQAGSLVRPRS